MCSAQVFERHCIARGGAGKAEKAAGTALLRFPKPDYSGGAGENNEKD